MLLCNPNPQYTNSYQSAGDTLFVMCEVKNGTEETLPLHISLVRRETGRARGGACTSHDTEYNLFKHDIPAGTIFKLSDGKPYSVKLPSVPPTFAPPKDDGFRASHPITWQYRIAFIVKFPGAFGSSLTWDVPITISPAPVPMLQNLGLIGKIPQPINPVVVDVPPGKGDDPTQGYGLKGMYLPPTAFYTMIPPTNYTPESQAPQKDVGDFTDNQQDLNNFGGPLQPYQPTYPTYANVGCQQAPLYNLPVMPIMTTTGLKNTTAQVAPMPMMTTLRASSPK